MTEDNNGIFEDRRIKDARYYCEIGLAHHKGGRLDDALRAYTMALNVDPDFAPALGNRAEIWHRQFKYTEAFEDYKRALTLMPDNSGGWLNFGNLLLYLGDTEHALDCMENAVKTGPDSALAWHGLGCAYVDLGRDANAIIASTKAIELDPTLNVAYGNRAQAKLRLGAWAGAWGDFEYRKQIKDHPVNLCPEPRWDGVSAPANLVIFLEQGLGDVIMSMKSVCFLAERGLNVTVLAPPSIAPLLRTAPGVNVVEEYDDLPRPFVWIPIMEAIPMTGASPLDVPGPCPYLFADPARVAAWGERIGALDQYRIGIVASPGHKNHHGFARRHIPLRYFEPLSAIPAVKLFSLQKPDIAGNASLAPSWITLLPGRDTDEGRDLFLDTAACMRNMDLVISTDTSCAHLAGALGVRTFLPVAKHAEWRWLLDRADSPWYPTLTIFRQNTPGSWPDVIEAMRNQIESES